MYNLFPSSQVSPGGGAWPPLGNTGGGAVPPAPPNPSLMETWDTRLECSKMGSDSDPVIIIIIIIIMNSKTAYTTNRKV